MANGGWGGFGQAWGQSMAMNRKREEKERKKDRRNMWLMQLVGAPVAQGITEGVTAAIKEPFRDPINNYFQTEQGLQLQSQARAREASRAAAVKDYSTLVNSDTNGWVEFGKPLYESLLPDLEVEFEGTRGYDSINDVPAFIESKANLRKQIKKEWLPKKITSIGQKYNLHKDIPAYDVKRLEAAVKKFNSEPEGWIQSLVHKLKRKRRGGALVGQDVNNDGIIDIDDDRIELYKQDLITPKDLENFVTGEVSKIKGGATYINNVKLWKDHDKLRNELLTDPTLERELELYEQWTDNLPEHMKGNYPQTLSRFNDWKEE